MQRRWLTEVNGNVRAQPRAGPRVRSTSTPGLRAKLSPSNRGAGAGPHLASQSRDETARLPRGGPTDRASHLLHPVSGGEQQRVAIAPALANRRVRNLVNESAPALDSRRGRQVMELIRRRGAPMRIDPRRCPRPPVVHRTRSDLRDGGWKTCTRPKPRVEAVRPSSVGAERTRSSSGNSQNERRVCHAGSGHPHARPEAARRRIRAARPQRKRRYAPAGQEAQRGRRRRFPPHADRHFNAACRCRARAPARWRSPPHPRQTTDPWPAAAEPPGADAPVAPRAPVHRRRRWYPRSHATSGGSA